MSCKSTIMLWAIHTAGVLGGCVVPARVELNVASASPKLTTLAYPDFIDHLGPFRNSTGRRDRKSTRLNSSHLGISYAVFCLKKKKKNLKKHKTSKTDAHSNP